MGTVTQINLLQFPQLGHDGVKLCSVIPIQIWKPLTLWTYYLHIKYFYYLLLLFWKSRCHWGFQKQSLGSHNVHTWVIERVFRLPFKPPILLFRRHSFPWEFWFTLILQKQRKGTRIKLHKAWRPSVPCSQTGKSLGHMATCWLKDFT